MVVKILDFYFQEKDGEQTYFNIEILQKYSILKVVLQLATLLRESLKGSAQKCSLPSLCALVCAVCRCNRNVFNTFYGILIFLIFVIVISVHISCIFFFTFSHSLVHQNLFSDITATRRCVLEQSEKEAKAIIN